LGAARARLPAGGCCGAVLGNREVSGATGDPANASVEALGVWVNRVNHA